MPKSSYKGKLILLINGEEEYKKDKLTVEIKEEILEELTALCAAYDDQDREAAV